MILLNSTSPKCQCAAEQYHLFVFFAVLDVSFAANSCLNRCFLHLYLQFYYISVAVAWYRVRGTWSTHFLRCSCSPASSTKFGTKVVIVTYTPNPSCVPNLKSLASTVAEISRGPKFFGCSPSPDSRQFWSETFLGTLLPKPRLCTEFEVASFNGCSNK